LQQKHGDIQGKRHERRNGSFISIVSLLQSL